MSRRHLYFIALILLAIIYSVGVFSRSIWYDEAITLQSNAAVEYVQPSAGVIVASEIQSSFQGVRSLPALIEGYIERDVHPPLYFGVANVVTWVFGNSLQVIRFVSVVLVLASVVLFALFMARHEPKYQLAYVVAYGLSFSAATSAHDARGYSMALLLAVVAWLTLLPEAEDDEDAPRRWPIILNGLACGGLLMTHYFAIFIVVPLTGIQVLRGLATRRFVYWLSPVVAALVFLPWLPVMLHHMGARPDQMTGFPGIVAWIKEVLTFLPGQIFSATRFDVSADTQKLGRLICGVMVGLGMLEVAEQTSRGPRRWTHANVALFVVFVGVMLFTLASIALDRSFNVLRYWTFFTPFLVFLAVRGTLIVGRGLMRFIPVLPEFVVMAPTGLLVLALGSMVNFGFETNRNRGGGFYQSIAAEAQNAGPQNSLIVVDPGGGRGATLALGYEVAGDQLLYLLPSDPAEWSDGTAELGPLLDGLSTVILAFTIDRGEMNTDKTVLYGDVVAQFERQGFERAPILVASQDGRHYAKWTR